MNCNARYSMNGKLNNNMGPELFGGIASVPIRELYDPNFITFFTPKKNICYVFLWYIKLQMLLSNACISLGFCRLLFLKVGDGADLILFNRVFCWHIKSVLETLRLNLCCRYISPQNTFMSLFSTVTDNIKIDWLNRRWMIKLNCINVLIVFH